MTEKVLVEKQLHDIDALVDDEDVNYRQARGAYDDVNQGQGMPILIRVRA
jgi:hypothetical protein